MNNWRAVFLAVLFARGISGAMAAHATQPDRANAATADTLRVNQIEEGRRLVKIAGCNECHTRGYAMGEGKVPEDKWLVGDSLGWRGSWGTTYPSNLRLFMADLSADQWVTIARNIRTRPPMPWYVFNALTDEELRSIHALVRHLGPVGEAAPDYLPPGLKPATPCVQYPHLPH